MLLYVNHIMIRIRNVINALKFENIHRSPQAQYSVNLIRMLVLTNIIISLLLMGYGVYGLIYGMVGDLPNRIFTLLFLPAIFLVFNLGVSWITRFGNIRLASALIVGVGWVVNALAACYSGGIYASALLGMIFCLIMGVLLLELRFSLVLYVVTLLVIFVLYAVDQRGWLPAVPLKDIPFQVIILWTIATLFFGVFGYHVFAIRKTEQLLKTTQLQATRFRVQQELTQNIAHDLRTPITILTSNAYLVKRKAERGLPIEENLARLEEQAQTVSKMIEDMAFLIDLDSDPVYETKTPFLLVERLQHVIAQERDYAASRQITIRLEDETGGKATVWGDPAQIDRVFENLIENAIHYGHEGGLIYLCIWQETTPCEVVVSVRDNGIGIAPEHHEQVFERFYRVDASRGAHRQQSTGIGLYMVQKIVQRHGGHVTLASTPAVGSTFTVYLPCQSTNRPAIALAQTG